MESEVTSALERGINIAVLFLDPSKFPDEKTTAQADIVDQIASEYSAVDYQFSEAVLPWHGTSSTQIRSTGWAR